MITGDDGSHFIASGVRARRFLKAAGWRNDELVGCETQFGRETFARIGHRRVEQTSAPFTFGSEGLPRAKHLDDFPFFRRSNQSGGHLCCKVDMEKSGTPQFAFVGITAALFDAIKNLRNLHTRNRECGFAATKFHAQRGKSGPGWRDLVASVYRAEFVWPSGAFVYRNLVMSKVKRWPQLQSRTAHAFQNAVAHVHRVLQVRKNYPLFQNQIARVIRPNRQPIFESKFAQITRASKIELTASTFLPA